MFFQHLIALQSIGIGEVLGIRTHANQYRFHPEQEQTPGPSD